MTRMSPDGVRSAKKSFRAFGTEPDGVCPSCHKPVKHRLGPDWCADHQMSEKTLQDRVRQRAKARGWRIMHVGKAVPAYDEKGDPIWVTSADPGWPDLVLMKPGHRIIFMELKREDGEVSELQLEYLYLLNQTGNAAIVVRPSDLRLGRVNAVLEGR